MEKVWAAKASFIARSSPVLYFMATHQVYYRIRTHSSCKSNQKS
jgi:hypothetical protein